jgi:hypothetical protein
MAAAREISRLTPRPAGRIPAELATFDVRDFAGDLGIHSDAWTAVFDGQ